MFVPANKPARFGDLYTIAIWVDQILYLHFHVCSDFSEALHKAIEEHRAAGRPLPIGTRCLVEGRCRERSCDCGGKMRIRECFIVPATGVDFSASQA